MKTKRLRAELAEKIDDAVRHQFEMASSSVGFSVLSITFENRSVDIPYQPWRPRQSITLPGRWVQEGDD